MRNSTIFVAVVFGLAMVGWFMMDFELDAPRGGGGAENLGRVNGQAVTFQRYDQTRRELTDMYRAQVGDLTTSQIREIDELAWEQVVNDILIDREVRRQGLTVRDEEVREAAMMYPHPSLRQNEMFQSNGQFDMARYRQFITGPTAPTDLLLEIERYFREAIPRNKLIRRLTSTTYPTDAELWQMWREREETATVEYLSLDPAFLVDEDEIQVTADEVRTYYRQNRAQFERPTTVRGSVAYIPMRMTAADSALVRQRALDARREIVDEGESFAAVARRESADPGSRDAGGELGTFGRGQMVPEFEEAAFNLPIGQVSEPVRTDFGYHLIEVIEREEDTVEARHILFDFTPEPRTEDRWWSRGEELRSGAQAAGLETAAQEVGARFRANVTITSDSMYVPEIGSLADAFFWVRDEIDENDAGLVDYPSDLFDADEALYVFQPIEYREAGILPLEEVQGVIRDRLQRERRRERAREIGQEMVQRVRAGESLEVVAAEADLEVRTAGPFTRGEDTRVFGRQNAAIGAAFGTPIGQVSDVAVTPTNLFIVRPRERTEASTEEWEAQKSFQRQQVAAQRAQEAWNRLIADLRREAEIVDRRHEVLDRRI